MTCLLDLAGRRRLATCSASAGGTCPRRWAGGRRRAALRALDEDPATELIVLVSKPPAPEVADAVPGRRDAGTPVVTALLGPGQDDLTAAAEKALRALGRDRCPRGPSRPAAGPRRPGRGDEGCAAAASYAGGTLCAEAASSPGTGGVHRLRRRRLHPGPGPPDDRPDAAAGGAAPASPPGASSLLDVVLGHGADPDPAAGLAPAIAEAVRRARASWSSPSSAPRRDPQGLRARRAALDGPAPRCSPPTPRPPGTPACSRHARAAGARTMTACSRRAARDHGRRARAGARRCGRPCRVRGWTGGRRCRAPSGASPRVLADPRRRARRRDAPWSGCSPAGPCWSGYAPAREVLGLPPGEFLHAGPPITWERASGPMRGALIGAMLLEGWPPTPRRPRRRPPAGARVTLEPCHHHRTVGPMAGVVSPSMWMFEVATPSTAAPPTARSTRAWARCCATARTAPR